jgi:AcrR family transcriptional regulator
VWTIAESAWKERLRYWTDQLAEQGAPGARRLRPAIDDAGLRGADRTGTFTWTTDELPIRQRALQVTAPDRRRQILVAARATFVENGYAGARTRTIATRAGTSEAVLYRHFASKEELFEHAVLQPLLDWLDSLQGQSPRIVDATTPADRSELIFQTTKDLLETMAEVTPLLGVALFSTQERGRSFYRDRFFPIVGRSFIQAVEILEKWGAPGFDHRFIMLSGFGTYLAFSLDQHFGGEAIDSVEVARSFVRMLDSGVWREDR